MEKDEGLKLAFAEKPLFAIIYNLSKRGDFQIIYLFNVIYFLIINYRSGGDEGVPSYRSRNSLVHCLGCFSSASSTSWILSPKMKKPQKIDEYFVRYSQNPWNWGPSVRAFLGVISFHQVLYFLTLLQMIIGMGQDSCWTELTVRYLLTFTVNVISNMPFILVYYYKWATVRFLSSLLHQLHDHAQDDGGRGSCRRVKWCSRTLEASFAHVEREIGRLAALNHTLNRLLSLPLIISMLPLIFDLIVVICSLLFQQLSWESAYLLQLPMHIAFLCAVEGAISRRLSELSATLKRMASRRVDIKVLHFYKSGNQGKDFRVLERKERMLLMPPTSHLKCPLLLVEIYRGYFELRVFNLLTVNWSFAFGLSLFILEYILLVTQTTSST